MVVAEQSESERGRERNREIQGMMMATTMEYTHALAFAFCCF